MADITKCKGVEGVTKCDSCYRKTAKANEHYQSYFTSAPIQNPHSKNPKCSWYWDNAEWQDPQRDKAIAQNGNDALHYKCKYGQIEKDCHSDPMNCQCILDETLKG